MLFISSKNAFIVFKIFNFSSSSSSSSSYPILFIQSKVEKSNNYDAICIA